MTHPQSPYYRRNRLDAEAQARYDLVIDAICNHREHLPQGTSPEDWVAVADHPELFWVSTLMSINGGDWTLQYYDLSDEEIARMQGRIERSTEMFLDLAPTDCSDWDKALYVYETVVRLVRYEEDESGLALMGTDASGVWRNGRDFSRTLYGPLVEHWGICVGFACMVQYLLQRMGIECLAVSGKRKQGKGGHAWDLACLDGQYCLIDATFGRGWSTDETERPVYCAHEWFGFSRDDVSADDFYYELVPTIPWPERIGSECDWFRRTGWFVEDFDAEQVDGLVERARAEGLHVLELKCASDEVRDEVRRRLEERHGLTCYPHQLRTLAAPLVGNPRLWSVGADGKPLRPQG